MPRKQLPCLKQALSVLPEGNAIGTPLAFPALRMSLEECLRSELAALIALVDEAAPRIADRRPWYVRLAATLFAGVAL